MSLFGQNMDLKGTVYDTTGNKPLENAVVIAVRLTDSLLLDFSHTDKDGKFRIGDFPMDTFALTISYPSLEDKTIYFYGNKSNYQLTLPSVTMQIESKELETVVIYANRDPIYYKGDTLVYVADSFKVAENAVVEDLLKKLPGIKVEKDGSIKSQGKAIGQVLVDGDEFFGSDATIATKNLGAKGVETVEVYEKKDENSESDETIQVLNLKLKEDAKKGYFGRTSLASDFTNFYEGEFLFNKFNGTQKISVFALGSNTPRSSFGWQDANRFGLENEQGVTMNEDGEYIWNGEGNNGEGIPQTLKAGIYYSDKIGKNKKTKIGFNYTYNEYKMNSISLRSSQYFLEDTTYFTNDSANYFNLNKSHRIGFTLVSQLDSLTTLEFLPTIRMKNSEVNDNSHSTFLSELSEPIRKTAIQNANTTNNYSIDNQLNFIRKFKKAKRELSVRYNLKLNDEKQEGRLFSDNEYYDASAVNDTIDQSKINENNNQMHTGKITYIEPLTKRWRISMEYMTEYSKSVQNKETRDIIGNDYSSLNTDLSNNFESRKLQNRLGGTLIYQRRKYTISGGARIRNISIDNQNLLNNSLIHQNFTNILPRFSFFYNPIQSQRFSFNYTTNAKQPSISDLQPVPNNLNPNRIQIGNPSLIPSFSHKVDLAFNNWKALTGRYIFLGVNAGYVQNDFVDSSTYDPVNIGMVSSKTVNMDGNYNASFYCGGGIPLFEKMIELNPYISGSYSSSSSFIDGQTNTNLHRALSSSLEVNYSSDSLECSLAVDFSYTNPKNSLSTLNSSAFTTQTYDVGVSWTLPWKLKIASEVSYTINGGQRAEGYAVNYLIWNAMISRSFLKTENLIVSIMGNDLLNQNISAQRQVYGNVVTDDKTTIISRYILLKLTMKFNNNKTKESGHEEWE